MTNFLGLLEARRGEADPRAQVILGPWVHGGEGEDRSGDRVFGPQARLDYAQEIVRFMDRYVRGLENGVERAPRVRAFVMGENVWRTGDTLPLPGTKPVSLYLAGGGKLAREAPAGERRRERLRLGSGAPGRRSLRRSAGAHDYRALAGRPDTLVFETEPLAEPLRVVGAIETEIYLSADAPDADLWVKLEDVAPGRDGLEPVEPRHRRAAGQRAGRRRRREAARGGRDRRPAPSEPAHRQPLREGPSRARRALRQLHAALLAQPPDRRVRDALRRRRARPRSASTTTRRTPPASSSRRGVSPEDDTGSALTV